SGAYSHSWICDDCPVGQYTYYAIDDTSGEQSNTVTFSITAGTTPQVSVSPSTGPQGTTFSEPGTGFTANSTATLYFSGPDGDADPVSKNTDGIGAYNHSWTCDACPVGQYSYYAVDESSGIQSNTTTFTVTVPQASPEPVWVPLFRLKKNEINDHYYTTIPAHRDAVVTDSGYAYEKIECFISDRHFDHPDSTPLYHLYHAGLNTHFYTSSGSTKDEKISEDYSDLGPVGYIYSTPQPDTVPFVYLEHTTNTDNFYTISKFEFQNAIDNLGFENRGVIGYVSPLGMKDPAAQQRPQANFGGIDLGTGAYRGLHSVDLAMKGRGPSLAFGHYYNSLNFHSYPMGQGWSHSLYSSIIEDVQGDTDQVFVKWGNGSISRFERTGTGNSDWQDTSGDYNQLTLIDNLEYGYDLKRKNQTVYKFRRFNLEPPYKQDTIVLISVEDWQGNKLTFDYQHVLTVSDQLGRALRLSFDNTLNQVNKVEEIVDGVVQRFISFTYSDTGLLETFTDARGKTTRYSYHDVPQTPRHNLLKSITYPKGNTVEIDYDQDSQRVTSITMPGNPTPATVSYPTANTTEVTDPRGKIFHYSHDSLGRLTSQ
ncbi:MAG: RHS repeat protein, partial [Desulfobulbaceae bacterium]|nr:RHS repeat protein [Desulfobulbaceae bacterium]